MHIWDSRNLFVYNFLKQFFVLNNKKNKKNTSVFVVKNIKKHRKHYNNVFYVFKNYFQKPHFILIFYLLVYFPLSNEGFFFFFCYY